MKSSTFVLTIFLSCFLCASNISSIKIVQVTNDIHLTAGYLTYPFVYFFSSIILATTNRMVFFKTIVSSYLFYSFFLFLMLLTANMDGIESQKFLNQSFIEIFNISSYRVFLSSILAYFLSMFIFGYLFIKMVNVKNENLRLSLSLVLSLLVDVVLFLFLSFYGKYSLPFLFELIFIASVKKILFQLALLPFSMFLISLIRKYDV